MLKIVKKEKAGLYPERSVIIWSKVMRSHIGLIICHFLVSAVSITESPKNKIMGKTGFYGLSACRGSAVE